MRVLLISPNTERLYTLQAIRTRRSIRKFLDKPVPRDVLDQVLRAAMYAPSACQKERYRADRVHYNGW